jgi:hypothetical protein
MPPSWNASGSATDAVAELLEARSRLRARGCRAVADPHDPVGHDVEAYVPDQAERARPSPPWTTSRRSPAWPSSPRTCSANCPLAFMDLQDVQELSNFFEHRVSAYQVGVTGDVSFDRDF